jgi:hypothetical protein
MAASASILDRFPLRVTVGGRDLTRRVDDGMTFANVDPGGYETATIPIPGDVPEVVVGQNVRIECGLATVWEGRVSEVQRSLGVRTSIACEGYGATLKEVAIPMIFVDCDMSAWQPASVQRKINLVTVGQNPIDASTAPDATTGSPSLITGFPGDWAVTQHAAAWYDAQGQRIESLYYAWKRNPNINSADGNWSWITALSSDDIVSFNDSSGELRAAGPGTGTLTADPSVRFSSAARHFAFVRLTYAVAAGTNGAEYDLMWTCLAVYGDHGLTKRGSASATNAQGFFAGDIATFVEQQSATVSRGIIIDQTGYVIPHLSYPLPVPLEQMLADAAKFVGCHWGVWESLNVVGDTRPRLDFRPYPRLPTVWCSRRDCASVDIDEQLARLYDKVVVTYSDPQGRGRFTSAQFLNPILVAAGFRSGRTLVMDGGVLTAARASDFGYLMLDLLLLQARVAGQATLNGLVRVPSGELPAFFLKAGLDRMRITDLPTLDAFGGYADVPIKRVETTVAGEGFSTNVEFGTGADLIETVQARLTENAQVLGF